jgi:sugar lactone lactonase YvrE
MRSSVLSTRIFGFFVALAMGGQPAAQAPAADVDDPVKVLVGRLDLERYKATIKGLTQFGDRRQGTDRNRAAVDWIEMQLKSYGCTNTERIKYEYQPPPKPATTPPRPEGIAQGGGRARGYRARTGVNTDPNAQPDLKLRELNSQPTTAGPREEVYCTKIGTTHPEESYIVGGHMDGHGWGEAANDDGSGTALVMEVARVLNGPDVQTERSIRFALWNNEETGLNGARAYVEQRKDLQGKENPPGSGKYPEPKWLGMIQHDMMLFDHGMPREDGTVSKDQRPEADVNIEFQVSSQFAAQSQALAWAFEAANEKYATDYPASVGSHMTNTDSAPFQDLVAAISLRENERGTQIGNGWDPQWHQPTDLYATYSDKDFRLGLNAAQTTLAALAQLTGARLTGSTQSAQPPPTETTAPDIPGVVAAGTRVQVIKFGFQGTEGPIALPDGSLIFTETQANRITKIDKDDNMSPFLENTNGSNGLAFDSKGRLISVQTTPGQTKVGVLYPKGSEAVLADNFEGKPFGRPNDLVVNRAGGVYFTDPGPNPQPGASSATPPLPAAVYYVPAGEKAIKVADGIERPNGIQLSRDEKTLFVNNTNGEYLLAFDIQSDGTVRNRRNFAKYEGVTQTATGVTSGADGLAIDSEGRLYVATAIGVQVFSPQGRHLGTMPVSRAPQNLAFAGADKKTLFIVGRGAAFKVQMLAQGFKGRAK